MIRFDRFLGQQLNPHAAPRTLTAEDEALIIASIRELMGEMTGETTSGPRTARRLRIWTEVGLMMAFALRPGEASAITAQDFILDDRDHPISLIVTRQMSILGLAAPKAGSSGMVATITGREGLAAKVKDALVWLSLHHHEPLLSPRMQAKGWEDVKKNTPLALFRPKDFRREAATRVYLSHHLQGDEGLRQAARILRHTNLTTCTNYLRVSLP